MALVDNLAQFNKSVSAFEKTIPPQKVVLMQKKMVLEGLKRLVEKTPVKTGRAKGNWQTAIGTAKEGQLDTTDKGGDATINAGLAALTGLEPFSVVWISNNLDYIEVLEEGSSIQAPEGMMALTVAELLTMFERPVDEVKDLP